MAKQKQNLTDIFAKTEPEPAPSQPIDNSDLDNGIIRPVGVGIREGEVSALDAIVQEIGLKRNALLRLAVRYFILKWRQDDQDLKAYLNNIIEIPPEPQKRAKFPRKS